VLRVSSLGTSAHECDSSICLFRPCSTSRDDYVAGSGEGREGVRHERGPSRADDHFGSLFTRSLTFTLTPTPTPSHHYSAQHYTYILHTSSRSTGVKAARRTSPGLSAPLSSRIAEVRSEVAPQAASPQARSSTPPSPTQPASLSLITHLDTDHHHAGHDGRTERQHCPAGHAHHHQDLRQ